MADLKDTGLSKQAIKVLVEENIDSVEKLCSSTFDDLERLDRLSQKALLMIAKLKESHVIDPTSARAPPTPAECKARVERQANLMKEPPPGEGTVTTKTFTVELQFRHSEWIARASIAYGQTEAQIIQQAIRQAYARDPYKAGDAAVSGSILKHDNPWRQQDKS